MNLTGTIPVKSTRNPELLQNQVGDARIQATRADLWHQAGDGVSIVLARAIVALGSVGRVV